MKLSLALFLAYLGLLNLHREIIVLQTGQRIALLHHRAPLDVDLIDDARQPGFDYHVVLDHKRGIERERRGICGRSRRDERSRDQDGEGKSRRPDAPHGTIIWRITLATKGYFARHRALRSCPSICLASSL